MTLHRIALLGIGAAVGLGEYAAFKATTADGISWEDLLRQSPVAVACLIMAILFLNYLGSRDKLFASALADLADAVRRLRVFGCFTLLGVLALSSGCINPGYAGEKSKADNELSLGYGRGLRLGAETDATLEGFEKSADGKVKIDKMVLKQSPGSTMAQGWVAAQDSFGRSIIMPNVELNRVYGQNAGIVLSGINEIAKTVMPTVDNLIAGRTSVALAKQQTKQLQSEMIAGIGGGLLRPDEIAAAVDVLPPEVTRQVMSDPVVVARLNQLQAQVDALLNPSTTQPATP